MQNKNLYVQNFVWKRVDDEISIRYAVLMHVQLEKFSVQSADFFDRSEENRAEYFDRQFIELITESDPLESRDWYNSIVDAIQAHDAEFSN